MRRSGEHDGFALSKSLLQKAENEFVVGDSVYVMHTHGVRAIVEDNPSMGNTLREVSLITIIPTPSPCYTPLEINMQRHTLKVSTPRSTRALSFALYHSAASGFVKSTIARPGCQRSHCHGVPSFLLMKYPPFTASSYIGDSWEMYGLTVMASFSVHRDEQMYETQNSLQTHIFTP